MEKHNINYWVYPGLSYNIYDANSAMKAVSQVFDISEKEIKSRSRKRNIADARFIYCYITKKKLHYTLNAIGSTINRDHSSVIHAIKMATILGDQNVRIKNRISILESNVVIGKLKIK
jgi:chromosomal replication initiator protein